MEQGNFEFDEFGDKKSGASTENDKSQLARARKTRLRPASKLLMYVERIRQLGKQKYFSYAAIVEKLAAEGGPTVNRLVLRRFVEQNLPDVFVFRSQFEFNRNSQPAKENADE